jgi:hypothetical protein
VPDVPGAGGRGGHVYASYLYRSIRPSFQGWLAGRRLC